MKIEDRRAIILVLDGVGIGPAPDSGEYGDAGAATLPHVAEAVGGLTLPHLEALGLGCLVEIRGVTLASHPEAAFGRLRERGAGKDSTTGHWELAGLTLERPFPTYPGGFPAELVRAVENKIGRPALGNRVASGTEIIRDLGDEHRRTGCPILYSSADSVFQLAAHEEVVPVEQLYDWCRKARQILVGEHAVGRVIARPFTGGPGNYHRTARRHDFSLPPPGPTVLDTVVSTGRPVTAIGKVADLFAGRGVTRSLPTASNAEGMARLLETIAEPGGGLVFATLIEFDTLYGHRNDPAGFARALAEFDGELPRLRSALRAGDLLFLTADHGNDPTTPGTDHTRELVPVLALGPGLAGEVSLGTRESFADVAATAAEWLGVGWGGAGRSFLGLLLA